MEALNKIKYIIHSNFKNRTLSEICNISFSINYLYMVQIPDIHVHFHIKTSELSILHIENIHVHNIKFRELNSLNYYVQSCIILLGLR